MDRSPLYFRLRTALEKDTECMLCVIEERLERRYIQHYFSELVMDPPSRREIVESRGFCNYHLHRMLKEASRPDIAAGTGMALVMRSVAEALMQDVKTQQDYVETSTKAEGSQLAETMVSLPERIRSRLTHPRWRESFLWRETQQMLENTSLCPLCLHQSAFTHIYTTEFIEILANKDARFWELFEKSKGLCVPHYVAAIQAAEKQLGAKGYSVIKFVAEVEQRNLARLNSEFTEYLRKHDYRFSGEPWGSERNVVKRGVTKLAGRLGLAVPRVLELVEGPSSTVAEASRGGEYEKLRTEAAYLTAKNEEMTKLLMQLESECAGLRFKMHEIFEDNKTLVVRLSGLGAENRSFRKMLEKQGLIQPIATKEAEQQDQGFREKYLFPDEEG